jgi:DNA-binding transcriptional ArsR family regulator
MTLQSYPCESTALALRDEFLLDPEVAFLNHGSHGACPRPVLEEYQRWQTRARADAGRVPGAALRRAARGRETCDHTVTYYGEVDDDRVFKALADPTRRHLLDRLFERDGRTLTELESELDMTRFGVMKHLRVLEEAALVVSRRQGREKLHFLNPVPIRLIHDRWIDKYTERHVSALAQLKTELEESA